MDAGDLHGPGRVYRQEHDDVEPIAPEQASAEMRRAVERLRWQLRAGTPAEAAAPPEDDADDRRSGD
jgi:hypothetical protein